MENGECA
jgi:hypothetical protein